MNALPNKDLLKLMVETFSCQKFGSCPEAVFDPGQGLVPRGFLGATGRLEDVQVIFVLAEPGHPLRGETYPNNSPEEGVVHTLKHTYDCFKNGEDLLHRNVRKVMSFIWPTLSFDEQLRHIWITESRLCSIKNETGWFSDRLCAPTHLTRQLALIPNAIVVVFGNKAKDRVQRCPDIVARNPFYCVALSPPGCHRADALEGWHESAAAVRHKFNL